MENKIVFITGGARSGKSSFAEQYAITSAKKGNQKLYYIATSQQEDSEMEDRIIRHRKDRHNSDYYWHTVECPRNLSSIIPSIDDNSTGVIDCLTILLTNELFQHGFQHALWEDEDFQREVMCFVLNGIRGLADKMNTCVIVSNEVSFETIKKGTSLVHAYMKCIGILHQQLVELSNESYLVEAGIPVCMKGDK